MLHRGFRASIYSLEKGGAWKSLKLFDIIYKESLRRSEWLLNWKTIDFINGTICNGKYGINRTKVKDKISIKSLLLKFNMLSVNQINASIKLLEIWKSLNEEQHPLKIIQQSKPMEGASTRASVRGRPVERVAQIGCII